MTPLHRTRAHYEGLALDAIFARIDPGMRIAEEQASLRLAGIYDNENKPVVEIDE